MAASAVGGAGGAPAPRSVVKHCESFLTHSERSSEGFTIRTIDELIHEHAFNNDGIDKSATTYKRKQERIIDTIKGCEVQIFNDPQIKYLSHRPHLSGKTGSLSNILTGSFYYLYYHVVANTPVEINVKDDLLTLFHAGLVLDFTKVPRQDKLIIQNIIQILLAKARKQHIELFTPTWWDELVPKLESITKELDRRSAMWRVFANVFLPDDVSIFTHGPYEDTVEYVTHNVLEWDELFTKPAVFEKYKAQLNKIKGLFYPESLKEENVLLNANLAALYGLAGGSRHSRKKMTHRRRHKQRARHTRNGQKKDFRRRA